MFEVEKIKFVEVCLLTEVVCSCASKIWYFGAILKFTDFASEKLKN